MGSFIWGRHVFAAMLLAGTATLMGCPSKEVVVIDDFPEIRIDEIDEDSVVFGSDGAPGTPIEVGDIVAGSDGGGYLRRVVSVTQSGDRVETETAFVSLAEAVETGVLDGEVEWTARNFADAGAPLLRAGSTALDFSGTQIYHEDGLSVTITRGIVDFAPLMQLDAVWSDHKLRSLRSVTGGDMTIDFDIKLEVTGPIAITEEWMLWEARQPFAFNVGPVPVVGSARIGFPLGIIGSFEGGAFVETGFDANTSVVLGGEYKNGQWTDLTGANATAKGHAPRWGVEAGLGAEIYIKVQAGLELYNSSDLSGAAIPYLAADAWVHPAPQTLVLSAGLDGEIDYELDIFDFNLVDENWYFEGPSWILYQGSWNN